MIKQAPFAGGKTPLFDFTTEPFVMLDGIREEVQGDLVDCPPSLGGEAIQFFFQFGWNLEIHSVSLSGPEELCQLNRTSSS
jgi:hypothetical protein